jgi:hypothetical protein
MTRRIGRASTAKVMTRITGPNGMNAGLAALAQTDRAVAAPLATAHFHAANAAADLAEAATAVQYPTINVYCEKIVNSLTEKFRRFSGTVHMGVEIRHSQDRLEGLQDRLELYADAVADALDGARGDWGDGMFYAGGYEVAFGAIKRGGRHFAQTAKVTFQIGVSRS